MQKQQLYQRQIQLQQFQFQQQLINSEHLKQIKQQQLLNSNKNGSAISNQSQSNATSYLSGSINNCSTTNASNNNNNSNNVENSRLVVIEAEIQKTYNFYLQMLKERKDYLIKELNTITQYALINHSQNLNKQLQVQYQLELKKQQLEKEIESEVNDLKLIWSPNKASIQTRQDEQTNSSSSSNSSSGNSTNESSSIEEHPSVVEDNSENNQNNETINCNSNKGQDVPSDGELVKEETTAIKTSADLTNLNNKLN